MAHPMNEHRAHKVEKQRVSHIAGGHASPKHYATGGGVKATPAKSGPKVAMRADGGSVKARADKAPRRARGGHVKGHKGAKTNVNVIVAPSGGKPGMDAGMPPAGAAPPMMPPKPPMPPPPSGSPGGPMSVGPPPGLGGMPPPPMRKRGGAVHPKGDVMRSHPKAGKIEVNAHNGLHAKGTGKLPKTAGSRKFYSGDFAPSATNQPGDDWGDSKMKKGYATGGSVGKKSLADCKGKTGIGDRTPISHSGNKSDTQNIGRGPVVTRATGGPIYSDGAAGKDMGPKLRGGSNSGVGRLQRNKLARSQHWEA